jgi:hypothetical protein
MVLISHIMRTIMVDVTLLCGLCHALVWLAGRGAGWPAEPAVSLLLVYLFPLLLLRVCAPCFAPTNHPHKHRQPCNLPPTTPSTHTLTHSRNPPGGLR